MKTSPQTRNCLFTFCGQSVLVDTAVLPTLQVSRDNGRTWGQGYGLAYLAHKLKVPILHRQAMADLQQAFFQFSGHDIF